MTKTPNPRTDTEKSNIIALQPHLDARARARRLPPMDEARVTRLFQAHDHLKARPLAA